MENRSSGNAKLRLIAAMIIFGTIGLFVRKISMPSSVISLVRGFVGTIFLLIVKIGCGKQLSGQKIRNNLRWLIVSGVAIGFNWILLFESYHFTSVAVSTLCYYMAPIIVILASPIVLREALSVKKMVCVCFSLVGAVCISGVISTGLPSADEWKGILCGFGAAALYASVMLMNQKLREIDADDKTIIQLASAATVMLPYCLLTGDFSSAVASMTGSDMILLVVVGIVHTGIAYWLYFGAMSHVNAQSVAIISYVDPVVAILISVTLLREPMGGIEVIGMVLILGAALMSEMPEKEGTTI